jgi:redox-sensitive bicupin YhaK (pirin superfamily)
VARTAGATARRAFTKLLLVRRGSAGITTGINYLDVQLEAGERWSYRPPEGHEVAWLAVSQGAVRVGEPVSAGELVVFEESSAALAIQAESATRFVLGSAVKHPHELVTGRYSVHTSPAALRAGEREIRRIGSELAAAGIIR